MDAFLRAFAAQGVQGGVDRVGDLLVAAARDEGEYPRAPDAVGEGLAETCVVASDGERHQAGGRADAVELGGFAPGGVGLVEVLGAGLGAGVEIQRPVDALAHLVSVGALGALAPVAADDVGAFGIREYAEA